MKDYYQIFGIKKDSTQDEIDIKYNKFKKDNQLSVEIYNIYHILNNPTKRKKYDELYQKIQSLSPLKIPYFGYDFDEIYINNFEQKRFLIKKNTYLIYEKENKNGKITKNYYIEHDGKLEAISETKIQQLKNEYYEQKLQEQKLSEQKSTLLKDSILYKVLPK